MKEKRAVSDYVTAESLSIVDRSGKPRTMLDADGSSLSESLRIVDKHGKSRIVLDASGSNPSLALFGGNGSGIIIGFDEDTSLPYMSASDTSQRLRYHFAVEPANDSASLSIYGKNHETMIMLSTTDGSGQPTVAISNSDGQPGLMIKSDGSGFHIAIFANNGNGAATIGTMNGVTRVATYNKDGKADWTSDGRGISQ